MSQKRTASRPLIVIRLCENRFAGGALNQLKVTAYEDIVGGDVAFTMAAVKAIEDAQASLKAKNDAWRLPPTFSLLMPARAPKSREMDHYQAAIRAEVLRDMKAGTAADATGDRAFLRSRKRSLSRSL